MARLQTREMPEFPNFISVAQAAALFGITKPSMYYKIYNQQLFHHVFRVGGPEDEDDKKRPFLLLLKSEVYAVKEAEEAEDLARASAASPDRLIKEWNIRAKQWGREDGSFGVIHAAGRPTKELVAAYQQAHPDDPFPA